MYRTYTFNNGTRNKLILIETKFLKSMENKIIRKILVIFLEDVMKNTNSMVLHKTSWANTAIPQEEL